ncbi:MAG: DinB family protein [Terracidiphilus sp.]
MDFQKDLIAEFDSEAAKTRKMLEAIPADADFNFKPHPKSMSLGRLAGHLTDFVGEWALATLTKDKLEFAPDHKWEAFVPASTKELLERFDKGLAETRAVLVATTGDAWERNWQFVFAGTAYINDAKHKVFRGTVLNHMIHHRGQLTVYLRLIGAKVPGVYGPSADEM